MRRKLIGAGAAVALVVGLAIPLGAFGGTGITANMTGAQVVNPSGGDPDGSAKLTLKVNRVKARVCYSLSYKNLSGVTGAFIHKGGSGAIARPIITLFEGGSATTEGCQHNIRPRIVKRLKRKPTGHYADVTTKEYPNGAVRGQLVK